MAKDYNTFSDVSTGDVYTAAAHNLILENVENYRVPPMCSLYLSGLSLGTGGASIGNTTTTGTWTEAADTDAMHDASTNPTRITANTAGVYLVTASLMGGAGNINAYVMIYEDGTTQAAQNTITGQAGYFTRGTVTHLAVASVGAYWECQAASASALTCAFRFSAVWLGQVS